MILPQGKAFHALRTRIKCINLAPPQSQRVVDVDAKAPSISIEPLIKQINEQQIEKLAQRTRDKEKKEGKIDFESKHPILTQEFEYEEEKYTLYHS